MTGGRSLRTRVAFAAALGATIIVAVTFAVMYKAIARNNIDQADRRLTTASRLLPADPTRLAEFIATNRAPIELILTVRHGSSAVSSGVELPVLPAGRTTITTNGTDFVDQGGATTTTLAAAPGNSGKLWRCRITPTDPSGTGTNYFAGPVAVNNRPNMLGRHNQFYSYDLATKKVGSFNPGSGGLWPRL